MKEEESTIEKLNSISIALALDFNPYDLLNTDQLKKFDHCKNEKNWFFKAIESVGYHNINPIHPSSFYVNVLDVSKVNLKLFLKKHIEDEKNNPMDEMQRLRGGAIVLNSDKLIFSPTCCTDITDFNNWSNIEKTKHFKSIWIGHPWVLYKTKEDVIYLTDTTEANGDQIQDFKIKYETSFKTLLTKARKLNKIMDDFEIRVNECLKEIGIKDHSKIAKCILKGDCEPNF